MASSPNPSGKFHGLVRRLDYPMAIVTVAVGAERSGCLVGFTTQCSIDPPRYLICLSEKNHTHAVAMRGASRLTVHVLGPDQLPLSELFGEETGDEVDKFARCSWHPGSDGTPVLDDARAWFSGPILERHIAGDHTAFLIEVDEAHDDGSVEQFLSFQSVSDMEPGHEP